MTHGPLAYISAQLFEPFPHTSDLTILPRPYQKKNTLRFPIYLTKYAYRQSKGLPARPFQNDRRVATPPHHDRRRNFGRSKHSQEVSTLSRTYHTKPYIT